MPGVQIPLPRLPDNAVHDCVLRRLPKAVFYWRVEGCETAVPTKGSLRSSADLCSTHAWCVPPAQIAVNNAKAAGSSSTGRANTMS